MYCIDAYILVCETIAITGVGADDAAKSMDKRNKEVIFKNWTPFTDCISEINKLLQIDKTNDIDAAMPMYN